MPSDLVAAWVRSENLHTWLERKEAAALIDRHPRTVASYAAKGMVRRKREQFRFLYHRGDLERLRANMRNGRVKEMFASDELCASCRCVLDRCDGSPDPTLCYDCWWQLIGRLQEPRPSAIPAMLNPAYLHR